MDTSAFDIEDDRLSKALPGLGGFAAGAKKLGGKLPGALPPSATQRAAAAGEKIGAGARRYATEGLKTLRPLQFTSRGIRPTKAGVGYAAGAAGLATGAAVSKSAFDIEDDRVFKALPGMGSVTAHLKPVAGAVTDHLKSAAGKAKGKEFRPLQFTRNGIRPTKAGVGYAAGAAGLAGGAAVSKSAFGIEDDRITKALTAEQKRQATVGGSVVAGTGATAGAAGAGAKAAKAKWVARDTRIEQAAHQGMGNLRNAGRLNQKARKLTRVARGQGRLAAALGLTAVGAGAVGTYAAKKKD